MKEILEHPMCDEINPEALLGINLPEGIFFEMSALLETEITEGKAELDRRFHGQGYSREKFRAEDKLRRKRELASNIRYRCIKPSPFQQQDSSFSGIWKRIRELADQMIYLRTADGKWQAEEIGKLCKVLLDQGGLEQEDWKLRKQVLADMAAHDYYGSYGCYEPIFALSERLCTKPEEYLEYVWSMRRSWKILTVLPMKKGQLIYIFSTEGEINMPPGWNRICGKAESVMPS